MAKQKAVTSAPAQEGPFEIVSTRKVLVLDEEDSQRLVQERPQGLYDQIVFLARCPASLQNHICALAFKALNPGGELLIPLWLRDLPFAGPLEKNQISEDYYAVRKSA